jgi:hypothetical protein
MGKFRTLPIATAHRDKGEVYRAEDARGHRWRVRQSRGPSPHWYIVERRERTEAQFVYRTNDTYDTLDKAVAAIVERTAF